MKKIYLTLICFSLYSFTYAQDIDFLLPDSEILSMMFPESRIENNEAEWEGEDTYERIQVFKTFVKFKEFYIQDDLVKCLVFTESNYIPNHCHACGALLGGAVFKKEKEGWVIDILAREIGWMGVNGRIGVGDFGMDGFEGVKISARSRGVLIRTAFANQGYYIEGIRVLGVVGNELKVLGEFATSANNEGGLECYNQKKCYDFSSKVRLSMNLNHILHFTEYKEESDVPYDVIQTMTGTALESKDGNAEIVEINKILIYHFKNGEYELKSTENIEPNRR